MPWTMPQTGVLRLVFGITVALPLLGIHCYGQTASNNDPQIEYVSPDGKTSPVSAPAPNPGEGFATFIDPNTVSCALKEGETTFIIELPRNATADRFTFLNRNEAACGELRIAVSNSSLPVDSPRWTEVDGIVPFAHKRLFKLSMLGVETKFVRLSFRVDSQQTKSAKISQPFSRSILAANISGTLTKFGEEHRELSFATLSVGPISAVSGK